MKRRPGLVLPSTIAMVIAAVVPVILLGWMTNANQKADLQDELLGSLAVVADTQHARINAHVRLAGASLDLIASRTQMRELFMTVDPADNAAITRLRKILTDATDATDELRSVALLDRDGDVVVATTEMADLPVFDAWDVREVQPGDVLSLVDQSGGSLRWWLAAPLVIEDRVVGTVAIERDVARTAILSETGDRGGIYTTCIFAQQGELLVPLVAPGGIERGEPCDDLQQRIAHFDPQIVHVTRDVSAVDWQVTVASSTERLFAPIDDATRRLLWLTFAVGILAAGAAFVVARWLTAPLRHLHDVVAQVRQGRDVTADTSAPGEIGELAEAFNDMTATIKRDQQEMAERYADLEVLTHAMAHDLKAPLTSMLAVCETLASNRVTAPEQQRELLQRGTQATQRMQRLIDDLLTLIRTIGASLERQEVDLNDVCAAIVEELGAGDQVDWKQLPTLHADPTLIQQALTNLIANAIAYHPDGVTPRVEVSGEASETGVVIRVDDAGIGFAEDEREAVIAAFARGRGAELQPGTGLGLSIAQRAVARHEGTVTLGVSPLGGARVELWLPPRTRTLERRDRS
ncbi:MAG: HAMP domain-containing sensor histidine kinase [Nitriliruptoraceae bacterium]